MVVKPIATSTIANALNDRGLFMSSVILILIENMGTDIVTWEPESIRLELRDRFNITPTQALNDKLNAGLALLGSDLYHKSIEAFNTINTAANLRTIDAHRHPVTTLDDIAWGVTECMLLEGPEDFLKSGFSHPIARYVGVLLRDEGISTPPPYLAFAELDQSETARRDEALASDLYAAETYMQQQQAALTGINDFVGTLLREYIGQLSTLPLSTATEDYVQRILVKAKNGPLADLIK